MANRHPNLLGLAGGGFDPGTMALARSPHPGPSGVIAHEMLHYHAAMNHHATAMPARRAIADQHQPTIQQEYRQTAIDIARTQLHVRETGTNRGDEVEAYTNSTGGQAGYAWCSSFAYWCHELAADRFGGMTTLPATFRAVFVWYDSKDINLRYRPAEIRSWSVWPEPGDVFVMTRRAGNVRSVVNDTRNRMTGHAGLVTGYDSARGELLTIEGNTDDGGSAEGDGVYARRRSLDSNLLVGCVRPLMYV